MAGRPRVKDPSGPASGPGRKAFLLRIDPAVLDALQRWADNDLRSMNSQIEFVLRDALARAGRAPAAKKRDHPYR